MANDPSLNEVGHYVVTSQPSGAVLSAVKCDFFGDGSLNVAIAKSNRLEIRQFRPSTSDTEPSLPLLLTLPINGRPTCLLKLSLPAFKSDFLFFTTERGEYALISYDGDETGEKEAGKHFPVLTHASGSFTSYSATIGGTASECGPLSALDDRNRCIALHLYDGWVTIIPIHLGYDASNPKKGVFGEAFHLRLEERTVLSMTFLSCGEKARHLVPQLAILHQDVRGFQHAISHGIDLSKKILIHNASDGAAGGSGAEKPAATTMPPKNERLKKSRIDGGSATIIAVPPSRVSSVGGVLILGRRQITYHHTGEGITRTLPISDLLLLTHCVVDETISGGPQHKYLLGDEMGRLHVLTLLRNETDGKGDGCVTTLLMETLGAASSSSALVYLGGGNLFLGSQFADSQLVKILDTPVPLSATSEGDNILEDTTYVKVVEEYTNLGPIVDFDLRPTGDELAGKDSGSRTHQHRQSLMATCSGVGKDGTVRLVRNGVGMREFAEVDMPGIKGMWSLRRKFSDQDDTFLVQSFVRETRILGVQSSSEEDMEEEESAALAEVTISGFESGKSTLFAGNMLVGGNDLMVQVVQDGVRLVKSESLELVSQWSPFSDEDCDEDGQPLGLITVASANESGQVVIALHGGILIYLCVEGTAILKVKRTTLDREISCIDLNPFEAMKDSSAMDVDGNAVTRSQLVAVGLWDDFSVRLLSLVQENILDQVLHINLGVGSNASGEKSDMEEDNGETSQHMMARSLCLVSLDSIAANSNSSVTRKGASSASGTKSNMLLVGLGDGKLISFAVTQSILSDNWSVHSRKEVSLGTHGISLMRLRNGANLKPEAEGTCVLATGDRPTVVYLAGGNAGSSSNPKLCYSTISLTADEYDEEEGQASHRNISVNAASSFQSSLLFSSQSSTSETNYSLCVSDENTLRLGVIDDVQKLHVTSYKLGMTPRRIAFHEAGRVYCVGCIDGNAEGGRGSQIGAEINMGNCVRFFDDSSFEEVNRPLSLEPFEVILSLVSVTLCADAHGSQKQDDTKEYKPYLLIGTAYAYPDEDEPTQGRLILVECSSDRAQLKSDDNNDADNSRYIRQVTHMPTRGGVYSICPFYHGTVLVTVNSKTHLCQLSVDRDQSAELKFVGAGHHGHILSLIVSSIAHPELGLDCQTKQLAIVGDIMRSISLVEYMPKHNCIEELARDYNANFCTGIEMLTKDVYLGSEGFNNLFILRHNSSAKSEEARVRLDTVGEYHLGEMPNKFKAGSLIMPSQQGSHSSDTGGSLLSEEAHSSPIKASLGRQQRIMDVRVGSQTLFATVDGSIGSILGVDGSTFAFLATLQRAMNSIVKSVGGLNHDEYRAFKADRQVRPSRGFIDGDLIETFLDLNRPTMEKVVQFMNDDGRWRIRDIGIGFNRQSGPEQAAFSGMDDEAPSSSDSLVLSVESVLSVVEEISMMH